MGLELVASEHWPADFWEQWDRLNQQHSQNHPMLQSRFVAPLVRYFSEGLMAVISRTGPEVNGILLVSSAARWGGVVRSAFLPSQAQIALLQAGNEPELFLTDCHRLLPTLTLRFDLFAVDSKYQRAICEIPKTDRVVRGTDMSISLAGTFDAYWNDRPRNLKKNINRYRNRLQRDVGEATLVLRRGDDVLLAVDRYGFLESRGWKGAAGTALHPGNHQGQFYREVLERFALSDHAIVFEMWANDQLYASRLCIHNEQQLIILKTSFREEARAFAPGRLLLFSMLEHLFESHMVQEVEFYTNASKEQLDWSTASRPTFNLSLHRAGITRQVQKAIQQIELKWSARR